MKAFCLHMILVLLVCGCATTPVQTTPRIKPPARVTPSTQVLPLPIAKGQPEGPGQAYFDPQQTGVPLFDTKGLEDQPLSRYFKVKDFARTGNTPFRYARIDVDLVDCLTRIQETTDDRMTVLSAYRSYAYNERIRRVGAGAAKSSFHISGSAADVVTSTPVEKFAVALYLECGCHVGFGVSPRFYHVDIRNYPVTPWGYGPAAAARLAKGRKVQRNFCGG